MSKVRDISNLSNVIRTDASGNVSFVSGSTTLATINTSGQLSGSSPVLSSSYALNATSASYAVSASNATNAVTASFANAFTVANTLTATTLVVQTVTSSVIYSSGSNVFGNNIANTQSFTGSVSMTGSLAVVTNGTEFQVNATGVKFGNVIGDAHNITGSVGISGSLSGSSATFSSGATFFNGGNTFVFAQNVLTSGNADGAHIRNVISTAANPTYAWSGDTDTGIYSDTANTIGFSTSGSNRFTITSAGNVGISTNSPAQKLDVNGFIKNNGSYTGYGGSVSANNGVAVTLFSTSANFGLYLVGADVPAGTGDPNNYSAYAIIYNDGTTSKILQQTNGTRFTITISGNNVQGTQTSGGGPYNIRYVYQLLTGN
jgi:hypothetical protein